MSVLVDIFAAIGAVAVFGLLLAAAWVAHAETRHRRRRRDYLQAREREDLPTRERDDRS
jgi:hypothetical protein